MGILHLALVQSMFQCFQSMGESRFDTSQAGLSICYPDLSSANLQRVSLLHQTPFTLHLVHVMYFDANRSNSMVCQNGHIVIQTSCYTILHVKCLGSSACHLSPIEHRFCKLVLPGPWVDFCVFCQLNLLANTCTLFELWTAANQIDGQTCGTCLSNCHLVKRVHRSAWPSFQPSPPPANQVFELHATLTAFAMHHWPQLSYGYKFSPSNLHTVNLFVEHHHLLQLW